MRLALMIQVSGKQRDGFTLGKLYVDDAQIVPKAFLTANSERSGAGCPRQRSVKRGSARLGRPLGR